jgi:hypothetical protein
VSGPALLLVRGEHERVVDWARKGVVAVHVVPLAEGWTGVLPAGERSAAAPPYDDAVSLLLGRPVSRRLLPAIGTARVGARQVWSLVPRVLRPRRRWLVWEPGAGLVRPGSLPAATVADLAAVAGRRAEREVLARVLRDGRGDADRLVTDVLGALGLPGAALATGQPVPQGATSVEPDRQDVTRFDRAVHEDRRWRAEVGGE